MEKLGMAGRRRRFLAGLLAAALSVLSVGQGFPITGPDDPLEVRCEMEGENLEVGKPFILTLVVNHGETFEVTIVPPDFRDKFSLEQQRKSIRLVRETAHSSERWSVLEFTLVPLEEGVQRLDSFAVRVGEQIVWTKPLILSVAPTHAAVPPAFRWETPLPALAVGTWSVFRLLTTDPGAVRPNALRFLRFEPPPEAVVESVLLNNNNNNNPAPPRPAAVLELRVLPMRPGPFVMNAIDFEAEGRDGTVMRLHIPELRATIR